MHWLRRKNPDRVDDIALKHDGSQTKKTWNTVDCRGDFGVGLRIQKRSRFLTWKTERRLRTEPE